MVVQNFTLIFSLDKIPKILVVHISSKENWLVLKLPVYLTTNQLKTMKRGCGFTLIRHGESCHVDTCFVKFPSVFPLSFMSDRLHFFTLNFLSLLFLNSFKSQRTNNCESIRVFVCYLPCFNFSFHL